MLDQHDGPPGLLALTKSEFPVLQRWWIEHDLPGDLYYPVSAQHKRLEPQAAFGSVVLREAIYSPLAWNHMARSPAGALKVESETVRISTFLESCRAFERAVLARLAELRENGQDPNPQLAADLALALGYAKLVEFDVQGIDTSVWRERLRNADDSGTSA